MNEVVKAKIVAALNEWEAEMRKEDLNENTIEITVLAVRKAAMDFLQYAHIVRHQIRPLEWITHRSVYNIGDCLVGTMQSLARFIWLGNLRNKITDVIEDHYGINTSALKVYPQFKDTRDGTVWFLHSEHTHSMFNRQRQYRNDVPDAEFKQFYVRHETNECV